MGGGYGMGMMGMPYGAYGGGQRTGGGMPPGGFMMTGGPGVGGAGGGMPMAPWNTPYQMGGGPPMGTQLGPFGPFAPGVQMTGSHGTPQFGAPSPTAFSGGAPGGGMGMARAPWNGGYSGPGGMGSPGGKMGAGGPSMIPGGMGNANPLMGSPGGMGSPGMAAPSGYQPGGLSAAIRAMMAGDPNAQNMLRANAGLPAMGGYAQFVGGGRGPQ